MKKLCLIYANCQGDGVAHFLKKVIADDYDFVIWHNWQLMMEEQGTEAFKKSILELGKRGGVFIYQPCKGYETHSGIPVPPTADLCKLLSCRVTPVTKISFAYQFNHGFFPFVKMGPDWGGWMSSEQVKHLAKSATAREARDNLIKAYFGEERLHYDCGRRFIECLAEQSRREEETDIKTVPWILKSYREQRLFLTYNHPTSVMFAALAVMMLLKIYPDQPDHFVPLADGQNENEAGMNGVQPVHPAVVKELGLQYPPTDHSIEYYQEVLNCMINELSALPQ